MSKIKVIELDEYQRVALSRLFHPFEDKKKQLEYGVLALCGESGELANKLKKRIYYGDSSVTRENIIDELSDVFWYVACVADALDVKLSELAAFNIKKILAKAEHWDKKKNNKNSEKEVS